MTLAVIVVYLALVLAIGLWSHRLFRGTGEDYFVATRSIGPFVLLMSLFGTHMTAFSLLGASGEAYRTGIGVFALMASSSAIVVPAVIYFVATRMWAVGKRLGLVTQVEYFRARWDSEAVGLLLLVVVVVLLVPYLLIGVMGGGVTLQQISGGAVPRWVGGLLVSAVVLVYVTYGGLRGTAWANTFQTLVFMSLGALTAVYIARELGGVGPALAKVAESHPRLFVREGSIRPSTMLSYTLIPLSAGMFPHLFMHWLSAKKLDSFKLSMVAYPLCLLAVWLPSVLLGVLGHASFPDLQGPEASSILIRMIHHHAPELLAGLLAAGVFAAIMSSLDSQVLSLGTLFTRDVVRRYRRGKPLEERQEVLIGRVFVIAILTVTFVWSLVAQPSIFAIAVWSFTGFAALFPLAVAALYWRRSTKVGAIAAIVSVAALWVYFYLDGAAGGGYTVGGTGILPVAVMVAVSALALVVGSLVSQPPAAEVLERFFPAGPRAS
ncbi:MAG: sodium:solute symporter family protein [Thermoanaerobaculia bacterium]|nr:sodium:solute symporter family protein [Thermoanaerobaculia bacterium]